MLDLAFTLVGGSAPTGTVNITVEKPTTPVAPCHIWVQATGHSGLASFEESGTHYDGATHEYYHFWTINGEPLPNYTAPTNLISQWKSANQFQGKRACIPLTAPGNYVIDLVVVDRLGNIAVASTSTITVADPDLHFADADTVYVDQSGTHTGVPSASGKVSSLAGLWAYLNINQRPHRVRLKRGDDYSEDEYLRVGSARQMAHIDAWGSGAKPIVRCTNNPDHVYFDRACVEYFTIPGIDQYSVSNLDLRGDWDSATESGNNSQGVGLKVIAQEQVEAWFTFSGCDVGGLGIGVSAGVTTGSGGQSEHVCLVNSTITNWRDYGIFTQAYINSEFAAVGSQIAQKTDALHGGTAPNNMGSSDGFRNNHGPVRINDTFFTYLHASDLFSRTGWSTGAYDQPCLRVNTKGQIDHDTHVSRCVMEGGFVIIKHTLQNSASVDNPTNDLFEDLLVISTAKTTGGLIGEDSGNSTYRNVMGIMPDVQVPNGASSRNLFSFGADNPGNNNDDEPVAVYNCTGYFPIDSANDDGDALGFASQGTHINYTEENNLFYVPNATTPNTAQGPVVTEVLSEITPRFSGTRYGYAAVVLTAPTNGLGPGENMTVAYNAIEKVLTNGTIVESGSTDQSYWLANGGTNHRLGERRGSSICHGKGLNVTFGASEITLENTTSGFTLGTTGSTLYLLLDRMSVVPALDTSLATPATLNIIKPTSGSSALGGATSGRVTPKDFFGRDRGDPADQGAAET